MPRAPYERPFVIDVPETGTTLSRSDAFDVHRPADNNDPLPAIVFVPGPIPRELFPVPLRDWPTYLGYARLAAGRGVAGVVAAPVYETMSGWPAAAEELATIVADVRALPGIDGDRVAIWAFSGGAQLINAWLADSPDWLRCLALTYPVPLADGEVRPGRPIVLTRVGLEEPERQAKVTGLLTRAEAAGADVRIIEVPEGVHGFDADDSPEPWAKDAVFEALDAVTGYLLG